MLGLGSMCLTDSIKIDMVFSIPGQTVFKFRWPCCECENEEGHESKV
jgi:hypothetical protein